MRNMPFHSNISKIVFFAFAWFALTSTLYAQEFEYLPPVLNSTSNKDTTSILLNTLDFSRSEGKKEKVPYTHSIQIIDADEPFPPRWFMAKPVYTDEMYEQDRAKKTRYAMNLTENPEVVGDYIFYLQIFPLSNSFVPTKPFDVQHSAVFAVLDKNYNVIDSIICGRYYGGGYDDIRTKSDMEVLTIHKKDTMIDWRSLSGNELDSVVDCEYTTLEVIDTKSNLKFSWNPLQHLNQDLFQTKNKLDYLPKEYRPSIGRSMKWLKIISIAWDYDGNILYGIEDLGIGKIDRKTGKVLWQLNYNSTPKIFQTDTLRCFSPYDFKLIFHDKDKALYSFYDWGTFDGYWSKGVVFEQNKKTKELKLVKYVIPQRNYRSSGHGGLDYNPSTTEYVLDYGIFGQDSLTTDFRDAFEYGRKDSAYSIYQIPNGNYPFGVHRLENFPKPPRPTIIKQGKYLIANGISEQWTWYKLEGEKNTSVKLIETGACTKFEKGTKYCVVGNYGSGYVVSRLYFVKK